MTRAELVIRGQIVLVARPDGIETAEAIGMADGRVVAAGTADEVLGTAGPGVRVFDVRDRAVMPGLHDFHIHLVGLARARRSIALDGAADVEEVAGRVRASAAAAQPDAWLTGRG